MLRAVPMRIGRLVSEAASGHVRSDVGRWLRLWTSAGIVAAVISGLGILLAATTDLTAPVRSQAADQPAPGPAPIEPYDPARGAAPAVRLKTPAQTQLVAVQRHYELADEQQATVEANYQAEADRRYRALAAEANQTRQHQTRIYLERQHRQVVAAAQAKLAELRREAAAAAATADQQRTEGREPPADSGSFPTGPTTGSDGSTGGTGGSTTAEGGAMPIAAGVIGARFGEYGSWSSYHTGVDFRASYGEPIHAAADGVVVFAGNTGDWAGNHVAVRHADGVTTMYSHMSSIGASVGQQVTAGQVIGHVGETGRAFGPHLHFEVYPPGIRYGDVYKAVDPLPWLASIGVHPR